MQAVLVFPALLFTVMLIIQFALYLHAQSLAEAAAQDGAAAARRADGSVSSGRAAVNQALASTGSAFGSTAKNCHSGRLRKPAICSPWHQLPPKS